MKKFKPQNLCEQYLAEMQCDCRSSSFFMSPTSKWTNKEKIEKAKNIALSLGYEVIDDSCSLLIYSKDFLKNCSEQGKATLISSHADLARGITKPFVQSFSIAETDKRRLKGTFDNSITNAVLLTLLHADLPQNTFFALTGDEETGRCYGAKQALRNMDYLLDEDTEISAFAMDVTWEGNPDSVLTFENIGKEDRKLGALVQSMINSGYPLTCVATDGFPRNIPKKYRSKNQAMFDEGAAYRDMDRVTTACSICIPTYGPMHSDQGMMIASEKLVQFTEAMERIVLEASQQMNKNTINEIPLLSR